MEWSDVVRGVLLMSCLVSAKEWCDVGDDHTMCKYTGPSAACTDKTIDNVLSDDAKQAVLDKHNELRRRVAKGEEAGQPKAANMRKMVYSEDLAIVAQRWADQCDFGHDKNRYRCDGTYVGQNAYTNGWWSSGRATDTIDLAMAAATQAWYDEVTNPGWTGGAGSPFTSSMGCGHYTQVVWAESDEIGCGAVKYDGDDGWKHNLVVCNYATGGNFINKNMYEQGEPASNCPQGFLPDDGLCSKDQTYYVTEQCDGNGGGSGGGGAGKKPSGGKGKKKPAKGKGQKKPAKGKKPKPTKGKPTKGKPIKGKPTKGKPTKGKKPKCPKCPVC